MKEKTKKINSWNELIKFVENLNHYKKSIYLSGWLKEIVGDHTRIKNLLFTTIDVSLLVDDYKETKKSKKKNLVKKRLK